jgi:tungstate transport system substrate-binding protein
MERKFLFTTLFAALALVATMPSPLAAGEAASKNVILSTTTSTQDSGLLDVLVPLFEKKSGYSVKTISVGTGKALELAGKGEADVALVHAPSLEKKYVAEGRLVNRRLVMYNDFILLGPAKDPANLKSTKSSAEAMKRIASSASRFVSRGDNSGTHNLEKSLWKVAGIQPKGEWYIESGQGMGATLGIANDRNAYTISDRATYLAFRKRVGLAVLLEGDKPLLNIYSVMEVNPANGPRINTAGGKAFADFMVSSDAQAEIKTFGRQKFGQALFVPVAGKREEDLGG